MKHTKRDNHIEKEPLFDPYEAKSIYVEENIVSDEENDSFITEIEKLKSKILHYYNPPYQNIFKKIILLYLVSINYKCSFMKFS
jgi:hypothetical protein